MARRVTVHDVAREANLSIASVSRALTGARPVTEDVATRVKEASARLGYRPRQAGRSLRVGRTSLVGLVLPDLASPFFPALSSAVEAELREQDLGMLVMSAGNDVNYERECVESLLGRDVDALLISPSDRQHSISAVEWAADRVPVVQIDRYASTSVSRVLTDPARTIELAVADMLEHGRTNFVFVGAASASSVAHDRLLAYQSVMAERLPHCVQRVLTGDFSYDFGRQAAMQIPQRWTQTDAVVCANDLLALGVVQGLAAGGRRVPADVAVTGCDDTFFSQLSSPAITSVAQPVALMAKTAAAALSASSPLLERTQEVLLEPELLRRGSTGD